MKLFGLLGMLALTSTFAFAGVTVAAPEIDGTSIVSVVALISGGLLITRSRRK